MSDPLGTAADEALALLGAAQGWVREHLSAERLATGSPECTACPLCQAVGALRHVRPDTVEHLLDATASLVAALRTALSPEGAATAPAPAPVQHIDVREG